MIIKVKGYLTYRDVIGQREIEISDDNPVVLMNFLRILAGQVGGEHGLAMFNEDTGTVGKSVAIMLNGCHYNHLTDRLDTVLKDQDEVAVFPPGMGG